MANGHGGARANSGGARPGSGRKTQAQLATFKELVDAVLSPVDFEIMLRAIAEKAMAGDSRAFAQIMDRYYGKATEHVVTEQAGEQSIRVIYVDTKPNEQKPPRFSREARENKDE